MEAQAIVTKERLQRAVDHYQDAIEHGPIACEVAVVALLDACRYTVERLAEPLDAGDE